MSTKKIFINAPVMGVEQNNLPIFQELQRFIWEENMEAYAPGLLLKKIDPAAPQKYIKDCTSILLPCDLVISHGDWFNHQECVHIDQIARICGIESIHHSAFKKWAEKNK